ncbi:DUF1501 domain-containing protein [Luteolibacter yonseiensis]|uniref:DUF1501 domain-containing protein n=1 Tax=Luteolibacter yonseiensis TaxID=1144680 RepID=A0A934R2T9_9BACT|nr:DUF1501 domain-containing protein [Luteolibacter yonseiensis]MBK1814270.1 DUF1501 domain-containing protein [Luteolibacter yonseiensis]
MKRHQKEDLVRRRDFIRQSACASLGVTGLVNALAQMRLVTAAVAQSAPTSDYKALVCLFLNGGHDSNNLLVPSGAASSGSLREDYVNGRGVLALPSAGLNPLTLPADTRAFQRHHAGTVAPLGLHPQAPDLAGLFNRKELAVVANVGTLAFPVSSRADYQSGNIPLPPQLFSHSDQQTQWQSSVPDKAFASGWGGRAADLLHSSYNAGTSKVSMSISLAGVNSFQIGTTGQVTQYAINDEGTVPLSGFGDAYADAVNPNGTYKSNPAGIRLKAFDDIMRLTHANLHEEEYNRVVIRARAAEGTVGAAITAAAATGVDFDTHFTNATTSLGNQLKMIAKLIAGRGVLGNNRQVFFCQIGGFDTHQTLLSSHADLITELNHSLAAFSNTLRALGVWDKVTTFTASDFNRTLTPNNTDPEKAGSDHAWGSHAIVLGGAVKGGDVYGHFPSLKTGAAAGSIDAGSNRGRWIPTTSVDQYSSKLANWFGVSSNELEAVFPNLPRFDDPSLSSANLAFI